MRRGDGRLQTLFSAPFTIAEHRPARPVRRDRRARRRRHRAARPGRSAPGCSRRAPSWRRIRTRNQTSPVHRGLAVRKNLLCTDLPDPPMNVDNTAAGAGSERHHAPALRAAPRRSRAARAVTQLLDPIGVGFENYDAIGALSHQGKRPRHRPHRRAGQRRHLRAARSLRGVELAQRLATSPEVRDCVKKQWFRYSLGRYEADDDACTLQSLGRGVRDLRLRRQDAAASHWSRPMLSVTERRSHERARLAAKSALSAPRVARRPGRLGAALSPFLPLLNAEGQEATPQRLILWFTPHGTVYDNWKPTRRRRPTSRSAPSSQPLERHRAKINDPGRLDGQGRRRGRAAHQGAAAALDRLAAEQGHDVHARGRLGRHVLRLEQRGQSSTRCILSKIDVTTPYRSLEFGVRSGRKPPRLAHDLQRAPRPRSRPRPTRGRPSSA